MPVRILFSWIVLAVPAACVAALLVAERASSQRFPKKLWGNAVLFVAVVMVNSAVELVPYYARGTFLPYPLRAYKHLVFWLLMCVVMARYWFIWHQWKAGRLDMSERRLGGK